ncbi:hypothetical protein BGZ95_008936 [Linnemannia exigua]|uniref:Uncharacterized protein n=1 Tax=Linnemannia exigua TaxID=604196 RepID=A0AAD4DDI1_9FUNG|nr:hypothetical protein BGZ95_008936 [Linnemannia exigua]
MASVLPEDFSPAAALLQEGEMDRHSKDTEPDYAKEERNGVELKLKRLECLSWYGGNTGVKSFTESVKCYPNL